MTTSREIALLCRIGPGGFSGELVFWVALAEGGEQQGLAPRGYCWDRDGKPLGLDRPGPKEKIDGLVAARRLQDLPNGWVVVNTPDGEVFTVSKDVVTRRPPVEVTSSVPV
jgi:hypothetical protein